MIEKLRKATLPLILGYMVAVLLSQALLITFLAGGIHLPGPRAVENEIAGVSLEIIRVISLSFTVDTVNFQQGFINETCNNCTMDTLGNTDTNCCHLYWASPPTYGLLIENQGTTLLSLEMEATANASEWIGGSGPDPAFQYKIIPEVTEYHPGGNDDDTTDSCLSAWTASDWTDATTTRSYVCGNSTSFDFEYHDYQDEAHITTRIVIPKNASRGQKTVLFLVTGTAP